MPQNAQTPAMPLSLDQYMKERVEDQFLWYEKKAASSKRLFLRFQAAQIVAAALIPFMVAAPGVAGAAEVWFKWGAGLLGVAIAVLGGVGTLYRHRELWTQYRTTAEQLKREKYVFLMRAGPYTGANAERLFVERCEDLMNEERAHWPPPTPGDAGRT